MSLMQHFGGFVRDLIPWLTAERRQRAQDFLRGIEVADADKERSIGLGFTREDYGLDPAQLQEFESSLAGLPDAQGVARGIFVDELLGHQFGIKPDAVGRHRGELMQEYAWEKFGVEGPLDEKKFEAFVQSYYSHKELNARIERAVDEMAKVPGLENVAGRIKDLDAMQRRNLVKHRDAPKEALDESQRLYAEMRKQLFDEAKGIEMTMHAAKPDLRRVDVGETPAGYYRVQDGVATFKFAREQGFNDAATLDRKAAEYQARINRIDERLKGIPYERAQDRNGEPSPRLELLTERSEVWEMLKEVNLAKKYFDKPVVVQLPDFKPEDVQKRITANLDAIKREQRTVEMLERMSRNGMESGRDEGAFGAMGAQLRAASSQKEIDRLTAENKLLASQGIRYLQNELVIKEIAQAKYDERYPSSSLWGNAAAGLAKLSTGSAITVTDIGAMLHVPGSEEARQKLEKDYAAISVLFPGDMRRRLEGGFVNEVLIGAAESLPQMVGSATPTALVTRGLMRVGVRTTAGTLAPALSMAGASYGGELQAKHQQADELEAIADELQREIEAPRSSGVEAGGWEVEEPEAIETMKAAVEKARSDAQKLRAGARLSAGAQVLIDTMTEKLSPVHAQGITRGRLSRMTRDFLVEGVLKEGMLEEGMAQVASNVVAPIVTQGVNQPELMDGVPVAVGTGAVVGSGLTTVNTAVMPGVPGSADATRRSEEQKLIDEAEETPASNGKDKVDGQAVPVSPGALSELAKAGRQKFEPTSQPMALAVPTHLGM